MIVIVGREGANIASVKYALERLNVPVQVSVCKDLIRKASHVILPGVGSAQAAMDQFKRLDLIDTLKNLTQPVLGICLGMQLLFDDLEEDSTNGLRLLPFRVSKLPDSEAFSVPHMGWNKLIDVQSSPLLKGVKSGEYVYYAHSYRAPICPYTVASVSYNETFSAVCEFKNYFMTQFHPEKSGVTGVQILKNFVRL